MLRRHAVLLGLTVSVALLLIATTVYPGGSLADQDSPGFDWSKNFISNLFAEKAVNGSDNPARPWADAGMMVFALSCARFFIEFSRKIPARGAARVIKVLGAGSMLCAFLIVTPLHDLMVAVASTLFLVSLFYIAVFVLRSRLRVLKLACVGCLLVFYWTLYLYGTRNDALLPVMQKATFVSVVLLILGLNYFTRAEDFTVKPREAGGQG